MRSWWYKSRLRGENFDIEDLVEEEMEDQIAIMPGNKNGYHLLGQQNATANWRPSPIISLLIGAVWLALLFNNLYTFSTGLDRIIPLLDTRYQPKGDLEIVVSMYDEDAESVATMITRLEEIIREKGHFVETIIYIKDSHANSTALQDQITTSTIIKRPNIGREGETYLHHILSRSDHLATQTLFIQAHVHNFWEVQRRIEAYLLPNTGMLSLGFSGNTCQCSDCSDRWGWHDDTVISSIYEQVYNKTCSRALLSYKGQFIASAKRLRGIDRKIYEDLHTALVDPKSWAHSEPYLQNRTDSLDTPYFGYALERLWSILLQCSEADIALKCPTLLAGTRRGGDMTDCQCVDEIG